MQEGKCAKRYAALAKKRTFYLDEAEHSAKLTIPSMFPPNRTEEGSTPHFPQDIPSPWQNFGAFAVESLAAKYLISSFPPNQAWFRYEVTEKSLDEARAAGADEEDVKQLRAEIQKALASRERTVIKFFDRENFRIAMAESFRHLVVAGNVLLNIPANGDGARVFHLSRYVVRRGPMGRVLELVVKESFSFDGLPKHVRELAPYPPESIEQHKDEDVSVYTHAHLDVDTKQFHIYQEAFGQPIPGSEGTVPEDKTPWIPLRFYTVEGESYGRSFVELYRGSLNSLEVLRRAIVEASASAARTLFMVRPNGSTKIRHLASAPNGGFVGGSADDVSVLRMDKSADLNVAMNAAEVLVKELSYAFTLQTAIQRSGERVTSTEVRLLAQELESTQGAIWSVLAKEMQLPVVKRIESILERKGEITSVPKGVVEPTVVTGLQAIGRNADLNKLRELTADFGNAAQVMPEIVQYLNASVVAEKIILGHSVPSDGLLKSPEEVQEEQQAAQQAQMQQQLMEEASKAAPGVIQDQVQGMPEQ